MSPEITVALIFAGLFIGVFMGFNTAFVLGGLSLIFGYFLVGPEVLGHFVVRLEGVMRNYDLLAVPLFLFMGMYLEKSGLAERLFDSLYLLLGKINGGLAISTVIIATIFAAATGVVGASVITVGLVALPAMLKRNYNKSLAAGTICAGGTLGILIPPSVMIIIYGPLANISVGKLFFAAIIPGILLSLSYIIYIGLRCQFHPEDGPAIPVEDRNVPLKHKLFLLVTTIIPPAVIILVVLGSIFFGIAAVTEAAAVGAIASMAVAKFSGRLSLALIKEAGLQTLQTTSMVLTIAVGASFFTTIFVTVGGDDVLIKLFSSLPMGKWGFLLVTVIMLIVLGMIIDWIGIIFILVPLITPVAAHFGLDQIWFGALVIVTLQISFLSPPFAYAIFYLRHIAPPDVLTTDIYRGVVPFMFIQSVVLILCIIFPEILTYLPRLMIK